MNRMSQHEQMRQYNRWRRGDEREAMPDPTELGKLIDSVANRLEVLERETAAGEIDRLRQVARNVYEVWAGSEGIPAPETAAEAYLLHLVEQMRDEAKNGLHVLKAGAELANRPR